MSVMLLASLTVPGGRLNPTRDETVTLVSNTLVFVSAIYIVILLLAWFRKRPD